MSLSSRSTSLSTACSARNESLRLTFFSVWRKVSPYPGWLAYLLMLGILLMVAHNFFQSGRISTPGLLPVIVWSSLAGLIVARLRIPQLPLHIASLSIGLIVIIWQASSLVAEGPFLDRVQLLLERFANGTQTIVNGSAVVEYIPFSAGALLIAWVLGYFSSWFLFRWTNPWPGIVFAGLIMITELSYRRESVTLSFYLFCLLAMLLVARTAWLRREKRRVEDGTHANASPGWTSFVSSLLLAASVIAVVMFLPLVQYKIPRVAEAWSAGRAPLDALENRLDNPSPNENLATKDNSTSFKTTSNLEFQGKPVFDDIVVFEAFSPIPTYWLAHTYDFYGRTGWSTSQTFEGRIGPGYARLDTE